MKRTLALLAFLADTQEAIFAFFIQMLGDCKTGACMVEGGIVLLILYVIIKWYLHKKKVKR